MSESHSGSHVSPAEGASVWLVGDLITVKVASEDTDGAFAIVEERTPPQGGRLAALHPGDPAYREGGLEGRRRGAQRWRR